MADKPEFIDEIETLVDRRYPLRGTTHYEDCWKTHVGCATRKVIDEYMQLIEDYEASPRTASTQERDDEPCSKSSGTQPESSSDSSTTSSSSPTQETPKETPKVPKKRTTAKKESTDGYRTRKQGDERHDD